MSSIEVGQVLSLRIRFNNGGLISPSKHPYLVIEKNNELGYVEIAQIDSLQGKEYKAAMRSNKTVYSDNPQETVIDRDSYVQLDNTMRVEYFQGLELYRRQEDKLSEDKLCDVLKAYKNYHDKYEIDQNKNVYIDKQELQSLNT